jgi:hypothetical protein
MSRASQSVVISELDKLFFLPLAPNETLELRALAIEAMLVTNGWTWDEVLATLSNPKEN